MDDRTLSDLRVETVGNCTTLTVNFNIRMQVLSHVPDTVGRELHIRIQPLDPVQLAQVKESLRTPESVTALRSIEFEGDDPAGPVMTLFFNRDTHFDVQAGEKAQALVIRLSEPGSGASCTGTAATPGPAPAPPSPTRAPLPAMAIPSGLYVINLDSNPSGFESRLMT